MNQDMAQLAAFLSTLGGVLNKRQTLKIAPGGIGPSRPAASRFTADGGVSDSEFVRQVMEAAKASGGGMAGPIRPEEGSMMPPAAPQMGAPQQGGMAPEGGGLGSLLAMLGGGGK